MMLAAAKKKGDASEGGGGGGKEKSSSASSGPGEKRTKPHEFLPPAPRRVRQRSGSGSVMGSQPSLLLRQQQHPHHQQQQGRPGTQRAIAPPSSSTAVARSRAVDRNEGFTNFERKRSQLPKQYAELLDMAIAIDLGLMSVRSRHEYCSIDQVRSAVELSCQRSFTQRDFAKVVYLFPHAYHWKFIRCRNSRGLFCDLLHVRMDSTSRGVGVTSLAHGNGDLSVTKGDRVLKNRKRELLAMTERAAVQKIDILPAKLTSFRQPPSAAGHVGEEGGAAGGGANDELLQPPPSSRLSKRKKGPLKVSDILPASTPDMVAAHRRRQSKKKIQDNETLSIASMLPSICQACYTEFNMQDKDTLIVEERFTLKIACSIRGTIKAERVHDLLTELVTAVPHWCSLTNIGRGNTQRLAFKINRNPEEFLKTLKYLMEQRNLARKANAAHHSHHPHVALGQGREGAPTEGRKRPYL